MGHDFALSHVVRPLVLAMGIMNDYKVTFATGERYAQFAEVRGIPAKKIWTTPAETIQKSFAKGQSGWTADEWRREVESDLEIFKSVQPDLIVGDMRWSLGISAEIAKIPYLSLLNAHWSPFYALTPPPPELPIVKFFGPTISKVLVPHFSGIVLKRLARSFNIIRKQYGLAPVSTYQDVATCAPWIAYLDIPALAPTTDLPHTHRYIGPVIWSPEKSIPEWWDDIPDDKPAVYVSMGSTGKIDFVPKLVRTICDMGMTVLLATSGRFEPPNVGNNVFSAEYLSGLKACQKSQLVVCNGGTGAVYQAISAEKPILGIPTNGDQYFFMGAVQHVGAGLMVRSTHVNSRRISNAVKRCLSNKEFKKKCRKLNTELVTYNAIAGIKEYIDHILIH